MERERRRILFVCTGNTCRSPLAAAIAVATLHDCGSNTQVESAGTAATPGAAASRHAFQVAREAGLDLAAHRARPLTRDMLQRASLVLVMGAEHLRRVRDLVGSAPAYLLSDYAQAGEEEVPDPFGGDLETYRQSFAHMRRLVESSLQRFQRGARNERI